MPLKTTVKVSHISNLSDARYCAGMGVQMLGVAVVPGGKNYMPPHIFQEIRGWIAGPSIVAELYGISSADQILTVMETYAPDYFELSFDEYRAFGQHLNLPCMVYLDLNSLTLMPIVWDEKVSHLLVDEPPSGNKLASSGKPVLIRINSIDQLDERLAQGSFSGVILEGPKEERPGITSYEQLGSILETLEEE